MVATQGIPSVQDYIRDSLKAFDENDWDQALNLLSEARKDNPDNPIVHFFLALVFLAMRDTQKAKENLNQGFIERPESILGHNLQALILLQEKKTGEALNLLKKHGVVEHPRIQSALLVEVEAILQNKP